MLPIVQPREVREQLAQLAPNQEITIDLPEQKLLPPFGSFDFDIDGQWKYKLLDGLDDIGITLQ